MKPATPVEIMIQALAAQVRNGELSCAATLSPIPAAALLLAKKTLAPEARILIYGHPDWPFDSDLDELFFLCQQGRVGLFFLSGAQIDAQANLNLVAVGDYDRPKVRLPGGAGSAMIYLHVPRVALFLRRQTPLSLVEKVDFVTSPGGPPGPGRPGGPCVLVTDLAVFGYRAGEGLVLASLHPGQSIESVQAKTGFALNAPQALPETPLPNPSALELIRGPIREELAKVYPEFCRQEM